MNILYQRHEYNLLHTSWGMVILFMLLVSGEETNKQGFDVFIKEYEQLSSTGND